MKKVLVLGAGLVTKPMIDYYLDTCGYEVGWLAAPYPNASG